MVGRLTKTENETSVLDMCAGSGALTIQKWNMNHNLEFICYELDEKVIPLLLFNLAIRNIKAVVVQCDVLQDEIYTLYKVKPGEKYGTVTEMTDKAELRKANICISNPPYNMRWKHPPFAQIQPRFFETELPPESNANYAFVLSALDYVTDKAVLILPCSVLTSKDHKEAEIRKYLIEGNYVESVITCPDKMFESTDIAVCVVVLNKKKTTTKTVLVDMRNQCQEEEREQNGQFGGREHTGRTYKKKRNIFSADDIEKVIEVISNSKVIKNFSVVVTPLEMAEKKYSLLPGKYFEIDINECPVHRAYSDIAMDINRVVNEKNACKLTINESLAKTLGFDIGLYKQEQQDSDLNELLKKLGAEPLIKHNYFTVSKNKNEIKFENNSKEILSSILLMILNHWEQHIFYLNREENRYLSELRDALLPELMSGKIKIPVDNPPAVGGTEQSSL